MPEATDSDSMNVISERVRSLSDCVRDLKEALRDVERRLRQVETEEMEIIKRQICEFEGRAKSFESASDQQREKWNSALNFVIQLLWVVTAAFVLTKLGLNMGPT